MSNELLESISWEEKSWRAGPEMSCASTVCRLSLIFGLVSSPAHSIRYLTIISSALKTKEMLTEVTKFGVNLPRKMVWSPAHLPSVTWSDVSQPSAVLKATQPLCTNTLIRKWLIERNHYTHRPKASAANFLCKYLHKIWVKILNVWVKVWTKQVQ